MVHNLVTVCHIYSQLVLADSPFNRGYAAACVTVNVLMNRDITTVTVAYGQKVIIEQSNYLIVKCAML